MVYESLWGILCGIFYPYLLVNSLYIWLHTVKWFKVLLFNPNPSGNTPQGTNYTTNYLLSQKLSTLDEPHAQDTAGEARTRS